MTGDALDAWMAALLDRHARAMSRPELLKAVRALSARYVERRATLAERSPLDSAGKRAAFAVFFAPLHFVTVQHVVRALGAARHPIRHLFDLGCGTGAASAAWARSFDHAPALVGVDRSAWALAEAAWNWRTLGLKGRTERADLTGAAARFGRFNRPGAAILLGWALNELDDRARASLLPTLLSAATAGRPVLIVEPLAKTAVPWWDAWAREWMRAGARADEWTDDAVLPPALAELNEAAGFRRRSLGARTLWSDGTASRSG